MELNDKERLILDAAAEVFAEKGFFKATVSEIANEAGVAKGTIYFYFENKRDLFKSLIVSKFESLHQRINEGEQKGEDFESQIKEIIFRKLSFFAEEEDLAKSIIYDFAGMDEDFKLEMGRLRNRHRDKISKVIQKAIEDGILKDISAEDAVIALLGIIHAFGFENYLNSEKKDPSVVEVVDIIYDLFMQGVHNK
ncbi:TetR/AcrR family transcriptional regulator [Candidatus Frackibacter sp. WG13]|uniref:TetR/AcrR family transcriptional regulator n=1 Tax=Candidatus Frackibacter sp. WG13 TaxID=2017978 RepID=UPI0008E67A0F|nr:TetR/AcrR family transcriptional regulator [Candidatus Frackibacter sp. WG13]SFL97643.1 DNA-binding transcriptional regulator, AcrR family [Candidatus Frackibacter sp. WG13]